MKRIHLLLMALVLLIICAPINLMAGKAYIWTDENGIKRFSDRPPEGVSDYTEVETEGVETPSATESEQTSNVAEDEEGQAVETSAQKQESEADPEGDKPKIDPEMQRQALQSEIDTMEAVADRYEAQIEAAQQKLDREIDRGIDSDQSQREIQYWQDRLDSAQQGLDTTNQKIDSLQGQIRKIE